MKVNKLVLFGIFAGVVASLAAGFSVLMKVDDAWFWPEVKFKNLSTTTPDIANLENLTLRESDGALVVLDKSKRAQFGFLRDHKYYRASFDPSRHVGPDNPAYIVVIYEDGTKLSDFPFEGPGLAPRPENARYWRPARRPSD